ncbi:hypothetical protein THRCLA_20527 [Thraustotheca clavata]|uniref:Secreted protein n=1 Tax=Thraustotheca clavata TaxID=74557 RepID=A0A1W0A695_9STRA|nr:hypothetical protein THRCLA_20527 [Thraustotheca clavata]
MRAWILAVGVVLLGNVNAKEVYAVDTRKQVSYQVFYYADRLHQKALEMDPRQIKYVGMHTNAEPGKKSHIKVLERKHKFPTLATIISITILLTTMYIIIKYFS